MVRMPCRARLRPAALVKIGAAEDDTQKTQLLSDIRDAFVANKAVLSASSGASRSAIAAGVRRTFAALDAVTAHGGIAH
jgi:hypothetical protein